MKMAGSACSICEKLTDSCHISANNLSLCHGALYPSTDAALLLQECEQTIKYFTGDLAKVKVYGKWHSIPRKQCAFGDTGMKYRFSGTSVPATTWPPFLAEIRDRISELVGWKFNFALCNRYSDGSDYIGEHRDDESDLVADAPIASLSLGASRDFIFRHQSVKYKGKARPPDTENVKLLLKSGRLLVMNSPTNSCWYHSLPRRANAPGTRVNLTFRVLKVKKSQR